jgi:hypothetical protein
MPRKQDRGKVLLSCHCERDFVKPWPEKGEVIWCIRHNRNAVVIRNPNSSGNYSYSCNCGTGRSFGAERVRCETRAAVHHMNNPMHTTSLMNGGKTYHIYKPTDYL